MIDLTPLEVRKKKGDFRRSMRGYDTESVDDFLDLVADRLEQLVRENAAFTERLTSADGQISDYREREKALTEALVTAQEMREEMRRQIEREVDLKRREADADAEAVRNSAIQMREREEENIRRLRARQSQFVQSYRAFLERELAELSVISETLEVSTLSEPERPAPRKRARKAEPEAAAPEPEPPPADEDERIDITKHLETLPAQAQMALDDVAADEELAELQLLDEVEPEEEPKSDDPDGWVSTLLEGKGD
jgi:cell division initiation protein